MTYLQKLTLFFALHFRATKTLAHVRPCMRKWLFRISVEPPHFYIYVYYMYMDGAVIRKQKKKTEMWILFLLFFLSWGSLYANITVVWHWLLRHKHKTNLGSIWNQVPETLCLGSVDFRAYFHMTVRKGEKDRKDYFKLFRYFGILLFT